jgi:hypothetical protein
MRVLPNTRIQNKPHATHGFFEENRANHRSILFKYPPWASANTPFRKKNTRTPKFPDRQPLAAQAKMIFGQWRVAPQSTLPKTSEKYTRYRLTICRCDCIVN